MPFDAESEDELFDLIVSENPQQPNKATMAELSTDAIELFLHVGVKIHESVFEAETGFRLSSDKIRPGEMQV